MAKQYQCINFVLGSHVY